MNLEFLTYPRLLPKDLRAIDKKQIGLCKQIASRDRATLRLKNKKGFATLKVGQELLVFINSPRNSKRQWFV